MKRGVKLFMSAVSVVTVGMAVRSSTQPEPVPAALPSVTARPAPAVRRPATSSTRKPATSSTRKPATSSAKKAVSRTVAGDVVGTAYGPVQVQITVRGGRITTAHTLARPSGGQSDSINAYAVPRLDREALAAQNARIDTVSGATYTSQGYRQSLQSAIDAAYGAGAR